MATRWRPARLVVVAWLLLGGGACGVARLTTHVGDSLANGTLTSETTEIPEEMLERLRALGYVR